MQPTRTILVLPSVFPPLLQEGPHSVIGEDEFFDAVESALDKMDEEEEFRERLRQKQRAAPQQLATTHPLWPQVGGT